MAALVTHDGVVDDIETMDLSGLTYMQIVPGQFQVESINGIETVVPLYNEVSVIDAITDKVNGIFGDIEEAPEAICDYVYLVISNLSQLGTSITEAGVNKEVVKRLLQQVLDAQIAISSSLHGEVNYDGFTHAVSTMTGSLYQLMLTWLTDRFEQLGLSETILDEIFARES